MESGFNLHFICFILNISRGMEHNLSVVEPDVWQCGSHGTLIWCLVDSVPPLFIGLSSRTNQGPRTKKLYKQKKDIMKATELFDGLLSKSIYKRGTGLVSSNFHR
jgi:hypothetical protein